MVRVVEQVNIVPSMAGRRIARERKSELGQFMTPSSVARFMVSLFPESNIETIRLIDAGAGMGSLTTAFLDRCSSSDFHIRRLEVTAYEIDDALRKQLSSNLASYESKLNLKCKLPSKDFIEDAVDMLQFSRTTRFTHAILNPPYKKIVSDSHHRRLLRDVGIETVNLYSAFVALSAELMESKGQLVAIIPRSFCNGPYYRSFRKFILARTAIRRIHLFASRNKAFKDDDVLQENVIIHLERDGRQGDVAVSASTDDSFSDLVIHNHPFKRIVFPYDLERFIHVPTSTEHGHLELSSAFSYSLEDLGVEVSTGPVVDFRVKNHLRKMPVTGSVPLLYPVHFNNQSVKWPIEGLKKPNAIILNEDTVKWLFPSGCYTLVRRFSSKEERRRIVASVVLPTDFKVKYLGFENHLNVFHYGKKGLPEELARGLAVYLNSTVLDKYFRRFSGHTQVNATDLRIIKYPSRQALVELGRWADKTEHMTQKLIDLKVEALK